MAWPNNTRAAITLTFDNLGEAADLNRGLHPASSPLGTHYSVHTILPRFLALAAKYHFHVTYFIEAWNLAVYPEAVRRVAEAGHEVGWHAWQHEAWGKECADERVERGNFERSFQAMRGFVQAYGTEGKEERVEMYSGFRPPGGTIHGERTLKLCREFGLGYISPAAENAAVVALPSPNNNNNTNNTTEEEKEGDKDDSIIVLPFRWRGVDAYYYMSSFSQLRELKGDLPSEPQPPSVLVEAFKRQIDDAIQEGGFLSLLFHPFLHDDEGRVEAMETVLKYLAEQRDKGNIWIVPAREVEKYVRANPGVLGSDPAWDESSWR